MTAWTDKDLLQMRSRDIAPSAVESQLRLFKKPPTPIQLDRPATVGDGIRSLTPAEIQTALEKFEIAREAGRFQKFVPASGAATRMFQDLIKKLNAPPVLKSDLQALARKGEKESGSIVELMDSIGRLAFSKDLRSRLDARGIDMAATLAAGDYTPILRALLLPEGLDYSHLPKGLIPFHESSEGPRTPFEEQILEGAATLTDAKQNCRLHFTVSPEYIEKFKSLALEARIRSGKKGINLDLSFSIQKPGTDTLAVENSNEPFRDESGNLVFRPGGHGALIENLNELQGDMVFVKNIDNVCSGSLFPTTVHWKKVLGGLLVQMEEELRRNGEDDGRPLRVCGVVRNTGEPGGGPFWVREKSGSKSLQIVESAQIDPTVEEQKEIFKRSTHFNPVDLVCSVRDRNGKPFDLTRFVDREAVFFSQKSHLGRGLKALELPGLWNGAMAGWNTVFVEVPQETFNPVKTVFDLLKPAHQ